MPQKPETEKFKPIKGDLGQEFKDEGENVISKIHEGTESNKGSLLDEKLLKKREKVLENKSRDLKHKKI
jgi:hypothetical protein